MIEILEKQRNEFKQGLHLPVSTRKQVLKSIKAWIIENQARINEALYQDLGKHPFESTETETMLVLDELNYLIKNLSKLTRTRRTKSPIVHFKSTSYQIVEPLGLVLVIAPWNYPFQLSMVPLITALAAGNYVALKPSELAPHTASLLEAMVQELSMTNQISIHQGGVAVSTQILEQKFDTIFFTGSSRVGSIVMSAAAKHLCPVILELGGKSPCVVERSANIKLAAKRIIWGKFVNAGQTCVAPDYVLVDETVKDELTTYLVNEIEKLNIKDMARIVNADHFDRLNRYLEGQTIIHQGVRDRDSLSMSLVLVDNPDLQSPLMQEEIFGPILPIISYRTTLEVENFISNREKPLAFYIFTQEKSTLIQSLSYGGGCVNDVLIHLSNTALPFGGVGNSGMGAYHGKMGFEKFSHTKSIMKKTTLFDIPFRYSPYNNKLKWLKKLIG